MLIGEVSKQTGLSKDTIRYYERSGLLKRDKKARRGNYYKEYSELDLKILFFIQLSKEYGFTLKEIKEFLVEMEKKKNEAFNKVDLKISKKIGEVEQKITELLKVKDRLMALQENL
ncbi:MAG TPA: MerR family transcriptional regulator [Cyclobacteriaceae bacterium]